MNSIRVIFIALITMILSGCWVDLYKNLSEEDANQMLAILMLHHIDAEKQNGEKGILIRVDKSQFIQAVECLRLQGFPRSHHATLQELFPANQLVVSPAEEQQKMTYFKEQRIESMLSQMDGVMRVSVTLSSWQDNEKGRPASSVAVYIKYSPEIHMDILQEKIKGLIEKSVPRLSYDQISILMQPAEYRIPSMLYPISAPETEVYTLFDHPFKWKEIKAWLASNRLFLLCFVGLSLVAMGTWWGVSKWSRRLL